MGANEPKKQKRQAGKHYRPNIKKQKPRRLKLRPLDPHERDMAEEHHGLVLKFLAVNRLPMEDYYDVVIFRYLLAVEKWFISSLEKESTLWYSSLCSLLLTDAAMTEAK